jgi:hypothetical protein
LNSRSAALLACRLDSLCNGNIGPCSYPEGLGDPEGPPSTSDHTTGKPVVNWRVWLSHSGLPANPAGIFKSAHSGGAHHLLIDPFKLEFDFFTIAFPFMLDIEYRPGRDGKPFPGNLDFKWFALLEAVGQAPQFVDHLLG